MLAAILAHAMLPTGSALQRSAGSAFSVTTSEVTTIPRRDRSRPRAETEWPDGATASAAGASSQALAPAIPAVADPPPQTAERHRHAVPLPPESRPHAFFQSRAPPRLSSPTA